MIYWVIYDISKNKIRSKIANICKDYGLKRVQKSIFLGILTQNKAEMLALEVQNVLKKQKKDNIKDKIFIVPAGKEDYAKKIVMGTLDEKVINKPEVIFLE
ncbi:MAG: CRISPR-associated endonuclease Cas2 [Patescibacteria group bacterium]|nr:CRISPR-associated endonuclease Cas2 [Patescibacteria group bacterium]MCL5095632.1 CRISPR-associated endonuclease Cas2 [Patescibacteria group bacterium]